MTSAIDRDILFGADYLKVEDKIYPPVIISANLTKSVLREGEISYLAFQASDSSGSVLKYFSNVGYDEMRNVWYIKASRYSNPGETFEGQHIVSCWVVNEHNLFSRVRDIVVTFIAPSSVSNKDAGADAPSVFTLSPNTPNPFNPSTAIAFTLSRPGRVNLTVYDTLGREVAPLAAGNYSAGSHTVRWDGRDGRGNVVSSGVYLYRLESGGRTETRKMLFMR